MLDDERAELMAIISECMESPALAWCPPPSIPETLSKALKSLLDLGGSGLWSKGKARVDNAPVFNTPPPS